MTEYFDLTQPQKRIWETERFYQGTSISNIGGTLLLKEELDFELLEQAINKFIECNDSIRLRINIIEEKPVQYLSEYKASVFELIDFTGKTNVEQECWMKEKMNTPFDLINSDLFEFLLIKSWDGEQGYYVRLHHIIGDAWTISLLGTQTMEFYKKLKEGNLNDGEFVLDEKQPSYIEYIKIEQNYLNSSKYLNDREYWSEKFKDKPKLISIKLKNNDYYSPNANRKTYVIKGKLAELIRQFCEEKSTSPAVLFEAALCIYIGKFLGFWDVPFGSLVLNRSGSFEKAMTGMFISTVPLKINIDYNNNFVELCKQIGKEHMEVFRHQKYPYNILLSEVRKKHKISTNLYDFSVSYQNSKISKANHDYSFKTNWYFNGSLAESFCLHIDDRDDAGFFVLHFDYLTELFTEAEINDLYKRIMLFLMQGIENENKKIFDMDLVDEIEQNKIFNEFNNTYFEYAEEKTIHQLFEDQVERTPDNIAIRFEEKYLTYQELNQKANQLARLLKNKGVKPDTIVGILVNRSLEMIVGILGVLKAGGAYLPIDTEYPPDRIMYMLNDSRVNTLIIQSDLKDKINFTGEIVEIDDKEIYLGEHSNLINNTNLVNLVYVIYTSGSTGNPKGVMVTHHNLVNAAFAWKKDYQLDKFSVKLLQMASFSFDVFAGDFSRALLNGGEMVICQNKDQYNPRNLYALIEKYKINIFESTPALIIPLMDYVYENKLDISNLKLLIIGSDICPLKNFKQIVERFGKQMRVINSYGVTEATIDTSYYEEPLHKISSSGSTPIGKPMANMKFYIVNEQLKLLPIGVYGELCIGGKGVAKGYINKPDLTAEKFIECSFCNDDLLYRTGDLARYTEDGNVEFFGRIDNQVKIRGFRIELGEIESQLLKHKYINDAVVIAKASEEGNKYLCGYIVSTQDVNSLDLKKYLLESLPDYMVPSFFVQLKKIPLTPNGKVDRRYLPDPDRDLNKSTRFIAPRNKKEMDLAKICSKLLKIKKIGIDDNLFELGADSLSIIQIQIVTYAFEWNLTMQDFYKYPTIRQLSERINEISNDNICIDSNVFYKMPEIKKRKEKEKDFRAETEDDYGSRAQEDNVSRTVLLTGSTGFLGVHILNELLTASSSDVYCLVRGKNKIESKSRLLELLNCYFPHQDNSKLGERIYILNGDISQEKLGLNDKAYKNLGNAVDLIIHSAATVKHFGNYTDFQRTNVFGTQQMINFANEFKLPLNHISTISVSGEYILELPNKRKRFTEEDFYIGQNYMDNLYVRSKFEAENLILKAIEEGLEATILRTGNLTGRYIDGIFQKNMNENAFYNRLKSIIKINAIPKYLLSQEIELTPVDFASKIIAMLSMKTESRGRAFHIYNHRKIRISDLIDMFNSMSLSIEALGKKEFNNHVKEISSNESKQELLYGIINDLNDTKVLNYKYAIEPESKITREHIRRYHLDWPEIDLEYIRKIIGHMKDVEFI